MLWVQKIIRFLAYAANIIMVIMSVYFMTEAHGREVFIAVLLALPPLLSLTALYNGPDVEERRLHHDVKKMALRKELKELENDVAKAEKASRTKTS